MASFREQIGSIYKRLSAVTELDATGPLHEGRWSGKEILGHVIDSAQNNHQRFVRASLNGTYAGPSYHQQGWVNMHGYGSMPWSVLLQHWRWQNDLLCEVVERIPENRMEAPCRVGDGDPVTLRFLVDDYLVHMQHHIDQI